MCAAQNKRERNIVCIYPIGRVLPSFVGFEIPSKLLQHMTAEKGLARNYSYKLHLTTRLVEDFELVKVDLAANEHFKPEFLAIQPCAQIPVFECGGFRLYVCYIAEKFKEQGLAILGTTLEEQAVVNPVGGDGSASVQRRGLCTLDHGVLLGIF